MTDETGLQPTDGEAKTTMYRPGPEGGLEAGAPETADYRTKAFLPFVNWVRADHPDDVEQLWITTGLSYEHLVSEESVDLLDRLLDEYAANP